jgi:preprotein translocase subunit SecD
MHKLFYILLAAAALITSRSHAATESGSLSLSFYLVSEKKIDGGRFINTPDCPKLGYIAAKPDLIITRLVAVNETVSHEFIIDVDKNGKQTKTPVDRLALEITILPEDAQKLETLTRQNIGKRLLVMLGDETLVAPNINSPISTPFVITIQDKSKRMKIENGLKKLVH